MNPRTRLLFVVAAGLSLLAPAAALAKKKPLPPLCNAGRFAVPGNPLIGSGGEVVVLSGRDVSIGTLCPARRGRFKRTRKGTQFRVTYGRKGCPDAGGTVVLDGLTDAACTMFAGKLKVKRAKRRKFQAALSTCGDTVVDVGGGEDCEGQGACTGTRSACTPKCACATVGRKPSRSSSIAISDDGNLVVLSNPDDDSVSIFRTSDDTRAAKVTTGDEPGAVVIAPDGKSAFVANRAAATVVKVSGIDTAAPTVGAPIDVGSEPTGLALSPTGSQLFVAEFAEGRVSLIDTTTLAVSGAITGPQNPRALAVTNDGDGDDGDELLIVPEFFGEPNAAGEVSDVGRTGRVRIYNTSDLSGGTAITFAPLDSGFVKFGAATTIMTAPNQLRAVAIEAGRIYVPSVSASPEPPIRFDNNVFPIVYVGDLGTRQEVLTAGTVNLARKVVDTFSAPRFVLGDIVDMEFVPGTGVAYVVSHAADTVQRVRWDAAGVTLGSAATNQINVLGNATLGQCQAPNGIAINAGATRAYVNCNVTRRLAIIDLTTQTLSATAVSADAPNDAVQRGKRFYFTGRGRWSNAGSNLAVGGEGWSSCGSCHPDGLTDNITWSFGAGPRQSTSMDGSFSHGGGTQQQRVFNWTGIFDEMHDFERNTRGVSGGLGAITSGNPDCADLTKETAVAIGAIGGLQQPLRELQEAQVPPCHRTDWDDIDAFVRTIRPPNRIRTAPAASVASGRALFETGQCAKCHGGPGWTLSRRFFTPSLAGNAALAMAPPFVRPIPPWTTTWAYQNNGVDRFQISNQPDMIPSDPTGPAQATGVPPLQVACVLRNVGTFGVPGNVTFELKDSGATAQGRGGYNIPSLYGLSTGAPYFHHGQARTLEELLTDARWTFHTDAGAANFSAVNLASAQAVSDLVSFLRSIDATQTEIAAPSGFDGCPAGP